MSAEFRKAEGSFPQTARALFFDHDGIAATNRIGRVVGHSTGLEHKNVPLYQRQIKISRVGRAILNIAINLASDLRAIFADAAAVKQHAFWRMARVAYQFLIE